MNSVRRVCSILSRISRCTGSMRSMRCTHSSGEVLGQGGQHAGGVLGLDLGQHHRDGLRVFVLQIVGEHRLVHVAELVPHGAARRAADLLHQGVDLVARHEGGEQALGLFERAHDRAGRRTCRETNSTSRSSTTLAETVPRLAMAWEISLISSSSSACHRRWRAPRRAPAGRRRPSPAPVRRVGVDDRLLAGGARSCGLVQPGAEDRDRLLRVLLDELGDLLDRARPSPGPRCGRCRCAAPCRRRAGQGAAAGRSGGSTAICMPARPARRPPRPPGAAPASCGAIGPPPPPAPFSSGRTTKKIIRTRDHQHDDQLAAAHDVVLVEAHQRAEPAVTPSGVLGRWLKRTLTTLTWSPRCWSKPTAERTRLSIRCISSAERGRVGAGLAVLAGGGDAVDGDRHRQPLDRAGLLHLGAGGLGDLVVGGLLGACRWSRRCCAPAPAVGAAGDVLRRPRPAGVGRACSRRRSPRWSGSSGPPGRRDRRSPPGW